MTFVPSSRDELDLDKMAVTYDLSNIVSVSKRELAEAMLPFYRHVAKQTLEHGKDWPKNELQRINALIKSDAVRHKKKTDFMYKRNVLNSFV